MTKIDRRAMLAAIPAATATPALAFQGPITETPEPDPIRKWLDQWKVLRAEWEANGHDEMGEETSYGKDLWSRADALEEKMSTTTARTADGALAQLEWMLIDSTHADFQVGHREALELAAAALRGGVT
ncbi:MULTISPECIES: hypothetical protein [unclassified Marinovum]|uniref:hypothetical protein n=1 Tax=unclassified Marinovum TaxID=2647166 RepID=UPI003EDC2440